MSGPLEQGVVLQDMYSRRFNGKLAYRDEVWQTLNRHFFSQWIRSDDTVLDLGCGYGEFTNNVDAGRRLAMDLNPDARDRVGDGVEVYIHDCSTPWPLDDSSLDVIFTSNFFEHLPDKERLSLTLGEAFRCLRPEGKLIAMGPNVRLVPGEYWDFYDHHVPLTDRSFCEAVQGVGFVVTKSVAAFLPYTMSSGRQFPMWILRLYLRTPLAWRILGKQFLVVAARPPVAPLP